MAGLLLDLAARVRAVLLGRGHHEALALTGVLTLATALRALARALALAGVSADALYLLRCGSSRGAAAVVGHRIAHEHQCDRGRQRYAGDFSLAHMILLRCMAPSRRC